MGWKLSLAPEPAQPAQPAEPAEPAEQQPPWTFDCCKDTHKGKATQREKQSLSAEDECRENSGTFTRLLTEVNLCVLLAVGWPEVKDHCVDWA